jgi:hypothetical protein
MLFVYVGLLIISAILLNIALATGLGWWTGLAVLAPGLIRAFPDLTGLRRAPRLLFLGIALIVAIAIASSSRDVDFYDTGLYHQQAVKWLADYGIVRGVALLCPFYGYVSSWSAFAAPLNHGVLSGRVAGIVGGLPLVLMLGSSLLATRRMAAGQRPALSSTAIGIFGLELAAVCLVWNVDCSLSPDPMTWLLIGVIVEALASETDSGATLLGSCCAIAALACLVKLTAAPALAYCSIASIVRWFRCKRGRMRLVLGLATSGVIVGVLCYANIGASGCPLYPLPAGCIDSDWSVGSRFAAGLTGLIGEFSRLPRRGQIYPLSAAWLFASGLCWYCRGKDPFVRHALLLSGVGVIYVFVSAPTPRYAMGYCLFPIAVALAIACESVWALFGRIHRVEPGGLSGWLGRTWIARPLAVAFSAILIVLTFKASAAQSLVWPVRMPANNGDRFHLRNQVLNSWKPLRLTRKQLGTVWVWAPVSSDQCWDAPLPCSGWGGNEGLAVRDPGKGFRSGFVHHDGRTR